MKTSNIVLKIKRLADGFGPLGLGGLLGAHALMPAGSARPPWRLRAVAPYRDYVTHAPERCAGERARGAHCLVEL